MDKPLTLPGLFAKITVAHMITYMFMGIIAYTTLDYRAVFSSPTMACWMRPIDSPIVRAGVLFQPIRGLIYALAFYPLREILFGRKYGWLIMWWLLVALGILGTFGPAPGSVEGYLYTIIPGQYLGYIEVVPQALLLSAITGYWTRHPEKKWLNWTLGVLFVLTVVLPILGLLAQGRQRG